MPRARSLKPSFFSNDALGEMDPLARLLFQGLWCLADRKGRLEDRPKRIKAEVLPYDNCDCDDLLQALADSGFILRYVSCKERYIQVVNFVKHQNPHAREPESTIPAPDEHSAGISQEQGENRPGPADSGFLIPESGSLIPDSGFRIPEKKPRVRAKPPLSASAVCELEPRVRLAFGEYVKSRVKLKRPMTERAIALAVNKLRELAGDDPDKQIAHIDRAVERGWLSFYPLNDESQAPPGQRPGNRAPPTFADLYRRDYGEEVRIGGP